MASSSDDDAAAGTRSRDSSRAETPRPSTVREPLHVRATRLMIEPFGWRVYTSHWVALVTIDTAAVRAAEPATVRWNRLVAREYERVARASDRCVALSIVVVEQDAQRMPVDVALRALVGDRAYVVRANERATHTDGCELLRPGAVYTNDVCRLAYCAMHALDFDRRAFEAEAVERRGGSALVAHRYRYAELMRQVAMARELERMEPLRRRCAVEASLVERPQRTSAAWHYETAATLDRAVDYVDDELAASTRRHELRGEPTFDARPFGGQTWAAALAEHTSDARERRFECAVRFVVFFARVPRRR